MAISITVGLLLTVSRVYTYKMLPKLFDAGVCKPPGLFQNVAYNYANYSRDLKTNDFQELYFIYTTSNKTLHHQVLLSRDLYKGE